MQICDKKLGQNWQSPNSDTDDWQKLREKHQLRTYWEFTETESKKASLRPHLNKLSKEMTY